MNNNEVNVDKNKLQKSLEYITGVLSGAGDMPEDITENGGQPEVISLEQLSVLVGGMVDATDALRKSVDDANVLQKSMDERLCNLEKALLEKSEESAAFTARLDSLEQQNMQKAIEDIPKITETPLEEKTVEEPEDTTEKQVIKETKKKEKKEILEPVMKKSESDDDEEEDDFEEEEDDDFEEEIEKSHTIKKSFRSSDNKLYNLIKSMSDEFSTMRGEFEEFKNETRQPVRRSARDIPTMRKSFGGDMEEGRRMPDKLAPGQVIDALIKAFEETNDSSFAKAVTVVETGGRLDNNIVMALRNRGINI